MYVGFYASQRQGDTIHSPMNCLPAAGWEPQAIGRAILALDSRTPVEVNRYVVQKGFDRRLVLYWYQSHGRIVASEYWSRAYLVMDSLRFHRSDGAIVRIIASLAHGESRAEQILTDFVHALYPSLSEHLPS